MSGKALLLKFLLRGDAGIDPGGSPLRIACGYLATVSKTEGVCKVSYEVPYNGKEIVKKICGVSSYTDC